MSRYYIDDSDLEDYGVVQVLDGQSDWHWTVDNMEEAKDLVDRLNKGGDSSVDHEYS